MDNDCVWFFPILFFILNFLLLFVLISRKEIDFKVSTEEKEDVKEFFFPK